MPYEIVERAPFGIYVVDAQLRIRALSRSASEDTFASVLPVVGRSFEDVLHVLWPAPVARDLIERFRRTLQTGEPTIWHDFTQTRNDTDQVETYDWELHRVALPDQAGHGVACYYRNVTAQREQERALRDSEARRHRLIDGAIDYAIIELARDGTIVNWNRGAERLLGWAEAEVLGRPGAIFFSAADRDLRLPERELETAATIGRSADERWHLRKDGTRFWGSGLVRPLRDAGERRVVGFVKIFQDRTRQKEAQLALEEVARQRAELLESERAARLDAERVGRMKDEFLATLSHELRTPLHAILGWSEILERNRDAEAVASGVKVIRRNARAQMQLIEELLDMSRRVPLQAGRAAGVPRCDARGADGAALGAGRTRAGALKRSGSGPQRAEARRRTQASDAPWRLQ